MKPEMMGLIVTVKRTLLRKVTGRDATYISKELKVERAGWLIGCRHLQEGKISHSGYDEQGYLTPTRIVPVHLVCFWPTMNAVNVLPDDYELGGVPISPSDREWKVMTPENKAHFISVLREDIKDAPRDAKGRFV